jgi:SseB protein C-terminal domain
MRSSDTPTTINIGFPEFLSEQRGPLEDQLKERLCSMFARVGGVASAYLITVAYEGGFDRGVVLGVATDEKTMNLLVPQIGDVFKSLFSADECLDIVLLNKDSESRAAAVCSPFYMNH